MVYEQCDKLDAATEQAVILFEQSSAFRYSTSLVIFTCSCCFCGSLILILSITPAEDGDVESLQTKVSRVDNAGLSEALGSNVTITHPAVKKTIEVEAKGECPPANLSKQPVTGTFGCG